MSRDSRLTPLEHNALRAQAWTEWARRVLGLQSGGSVDDGVAHDAELRAALMQRMQPDMVMEFHFSRPTAAAVQSPPHTQPKIGDRLLAADVPIGGVVLKESGQLVIRHQHDLGHRVYDPPHTWWWCDSTYEWYWDSLIVDRDSRTELVAIVDASGQARDRVERCRDALKHDPRFAAVAAAPSPAIKIGDRLSGKDVPVGGVMRKSSGHLVIRASADFGHYVFDPPNTWASEAPTSWPWRYLGADGDGRTKLVAIVDVSGEWADRVQRCRDTLCGANQ